MTPVEKLLAKLSCVKTNRTGWTARCPAHEDRTPSLSVSEGDDGRALVKCHAGCKVEAVVGAIDLRVADLMPAVASRPAKLKSAKPEAPEHESPVASAKAPLPNGRTYRTVEEAIAVLERGLGKRSSSWIYRNAGGEPVGLVIRWDLPDGSKTIRPVSRIADGWQIGAMAKPRPLYNLPELADAERIVVVEGEKAVDAAQSLGFTATTSSGGAEAPHATDWQPLAGKEVWILPDNDAPGRKYADTVAALLAKQMPAPLVKLIGLPGLPERGDLADWIVLAGGTAVPHELKLRLEAIAQTVEPERNGPFMDDPTRFRPFPVDALPEPIRGFVAGGAEAIGCDPSYLALPLLTALASAIGNTRRLELKPGWEAPPIVWTVIVGESGSLKTPAFKRAMKPFRKLEAKAMVRNAEAMQRYAEDLARWEKKTASWKKGKNNSDQPPVKPTPPRAERYMVSDTTLEALAPILLENPRGMLSCHDELNGWIGGFDRYAPKGKSGSDLSNWLQMYNAEPIIIDRKTAIPRTIYVPMAAVCVTGGIQPGVLKRVLGKEHRESGFLARLLVACPPPVRKQWTEATIDPALEAALARVVDRLYDLQSVPNEEGAPEPVVVRMTPEAKSAWVAYYNAHAVEQRDLTGDLAAAWSKLEETPARLALVIHFIRWAAACPGEATPEADLDLQSISAGIRLATWFKRETDRVYDLLAEDDADADQRRLTEWIGRRGGQVTVRETQQGCRWLKAPGAAETALEELVGWGQGEWQGHPTTAKGGQPTRIFKMAVHRRTTEAHVGEGGSVDVDTVDVSPPPPAGPHRGGE